MTADRVKYKSYKEAPNAGQTEASAPKIDTVIYPFPAPAEKNGNTQDEEMRDVDLDRETAAAREHREAVEKAREGVEAAFDQGEVFSA